MENVDLQLLGIFIGLNALNVVIQTVKSLCTINGSKLVAATANAVAYGLYTVVVIYMVCDLPLLWKCLIIGGCNFIGVYIVKWVEEKARKDKLWKVEATIRTSHADALHKTLDKCQIPHNYMEIHKWTVFNCYCKSKEQSRKVKAELNRHNAKYFVSETKYL